MNTTRPLFPFPRRTVSVPVTNSKAANVERQQLGSAHAGIEQRQEDCRVMLSVEVTVTDFQQPSHVVHFNRVKDLLRDFGGFNRRAVPLARLATRKPSIH